MADGLREGAYPEVVCQPVGHPLMPGALGWPSNLPLRMPHCHVAASSQSRPVYLRWLTVTDTLFSHLPVGTCALLVVEDHWFSGLPLTPNFLLPVQSSLLDTTALHTVLPVQQMSVPCRAHPPYPMVEGAGGTAFCVRTHASCCSQRSGRRNKWGRTLRA